MLIQEVFGRSEDDSIFYVEVDEGLLDVKINQGKEDEGDNGEYIVLLTDFSIEEQSRQGEDVERNEVMWN